MSTPQPPTRKNLLEVAGVFLRLGTTAFGGPAAHIALMQQEIVGRRAWVSAEEFLDLLGAVNLIPGPSSTEMAIFLGFRRAGWMGLVLGGCCFILPAALIVSALAWAYMHFGKLPQVEALLYGIKPVIIAIVVQALWKLGRTAAKTRWLVAIGVAAAALDLLGINVLLVLFGTGLLTATARALASRKRPGAASLSPLLAATPALAIGTGAAFTTVPFTISRLFLFFLKVGSVLFGSGYVLLAFLHDDLVTHWHWLTQSQLLDAVAVGQFTPGPVFTTATFIGYILGGPWAAFVATVGIFLPSFVFVAISGPLLPRLRRSPVAGAFLDGVNVASLALMAVVTWQLGSAALVDWLTVLLAIIGAVVLLRWPVNSAWLVLAGALIGVARALL
jgi:chromate transporter